MRSADALTVAESTLHRWLAQYGGMKANDAKRLQELEAQNARLKKRVANQALDIDMLKGVGGGKRLTPNRRRGAVVVLRERCGVSESAGRAGLSVSTAPPNGSCHRWSTIRNGACANS